MFAISKLVASKSVAGRIVSAFTNSNKSSFLEQFRLFSAAPGSVKWFDPKKGYGYITPDDGAPDVFVHQSVIHAEGFRTLAEGEPVEFEMTTAPDGRTRAERVTGPNGTYVQGAPRQAFEEYTPRGGSRGGDQY